MIYFNLLKNYFEGNRHIFNDDYKTTIEKFNLQSLSPYLYYVYGQQFFNIYLAALKVQERFFKLEKELNNLFKEVTVPHFYIKGTVLSKLYDDPVLRTRGDIDLVIKKEDKDKVKELLLNNDFIYESECSHHQCYFKNNLCIEVHTKLFPEEMNNIEEFNNPFLHTTLLKDSLYKLDDTYHYFFCILHFNKHLKYGEGLRYLLDFYYMQHKFNIDYDLLDKLINKYKLNKLHNNIINSLYKITNEKLHGFTNEDSLFFIEYLEHSGVHAKNTDILLVSVNQSKSKLYFFLDKIFMFSKEDRRILYPKLSKCFTFYPLMVIHRFFSLVFKKLKLGLKVLNYKTVEKTKIDEMYSKLGVIEL